MPRDFWLNRREVRRVGRLNKTLTIPSFSLECGENPSCIKLTSGATSGTRAEAEHIPLAQGDWQDAYTFEAWVKLLRYPNTGQFTTLFAPGIGGAPQVVVYITPAGLVKFSILKGAAYTTVTSTNAVPVQGWFFISCSWDGSNMRIYQNGILISAVQALVAPMDAVLAHRNIIGYTDISGDIYTDIQALFDEVRIWREGRTKDQILATMNSPRNYTPGDGIDDGLKFYYKFQEGAGNTSTEKITGEVVSLLLSTTQYHWETEDSFPLKYGASRIIKRFTISGDRKCSILNFTPPENADHCLCVSWVDDEGDFQRRKLYGAIASDDGRYGVELFYPIPANYNGEALSEDFVIEVWNVDGRPTANLEEDLVFEFSVTSAPSSVLDSTQLVYATPNGTTILWDTFPITGLELIPDTTKIFN